MPHPYSVGSATRLILIMVFGHNCSVTTSKLLVLLLLLSLLHPLFLLQRGACPYIQKFVVIIIIKIIVMTGCKSWWLSKDMQNYDDDNDNDNDNANDNYNWVQVMVSVYGYAKLLS